MSRFTDFLDEVREAGVRFLDRIGRERAAPSHVRTVMQDAVVDAYNGALVMRARIRGSPGVRVADALLGDTDEACETANGQTWSHAIALANKKEHPNCTRQFSPLPRGWGGELDRE